MVGSAPTPTLDVLIRLSPRVRVTGDLMALILTAPSLEANSRRESDALRGPRFRPPDTE